MDSWTPKRLKIMQNQRGSHKIEVSRIQEKTGYRAPFRVILRVILEPFGSQSQIYCDLLRFYFRLKIMNFEIY